MTVDCDIENALWFDRFSLCVIWRKLWIASHSSSSSIHPQLRMSLIFHHCAVNVRLHFSADTMSIEACASLSMSRLFHRRCCHSSSRTYTKRNAESSLSISADRRNTNRENERHVFRQTNGRIKKAKEKKTDGCGDDGTDDVDCE